MIHVDAMILALVSGSVIPLVTGIVTKMSAPSGLKALVSTILSGVTALVAYLTDWNGVGTWKEALVVGLTALIAHAGSYHGVLKPTGVAPALGQSTGPFGLG